MENEIKVEEEPQVFVVGGDGRNRTGTRVRRTESETFEEALRKLEVNRDGSGVHEVVCGDVSARPLPSWGRNG